MRIIAFLLFCLGALFSSSLPAQQSFSGVFHKTSATHIYLYQITWDELIRRNDELAKDSFQLIDLEAVPGEEEVSFWGIWRKTTRPARIERASGWENIIKVKRRMQAEGYTLIDIEGYRDPSGADLFAGIWIRGKEEQKLWKLDSWEGVLQNTAKQSKDYFQIVDIEAYIDEWGTTNYLAVYHKMSPSQRGYLVQTDDAETFAKERTLRHKSGYALIDLETYEVNGRQMRLGMYKKTNIDEATNTYLDWESFVTYQDQLGEQYSLVDLELGGGDGQLVIPAYHTSRLETTPSISQEVVSAMIRSVDKDQLQSAPCAAANGLIWLSEQGFPKLLGDLDEEALARKLAGGNYMKSLRPGGPATYGVFNGLLAYLEESPYEVESIAYQDIRDFDVTRIAIDSAQAPKLQTQAAHAELRFAKEGLVGNSLVLVGWAVYEPQPGDSLRQSYRKVADYWGTAVGYGVNEHDTEVPNTLIVHSPTHGAEPLFLKVEELDNRILLDEETQLLAPGAEEAMNPVPAAQQSYLRNAMQEEGERFAVWERTLVVKLKTPMTDSQKKLPQDKRLGGGW